MYTRILIAVDGSELASKALRHAFALAKGTQAKLIVLTATDPSVPIAPGAEIMMVDTGAIIADLEKAKAEGAKTVLAEARELARDAGLAVQTLHVPGHLPADAIIAAAKEQGADLIVMGSHGRRGLGRLLLGSQAAEVLARSTIPVLVVK
jgi:nucleotide-binding universal stress UspA family protein